MKLFNIGKEEDKRILTIFGFIRIKWKCRCVNGVNLLNLIKGKTSYKPSIFTVETSLVCDLKCTECAMGKGLITRKKGFMKFDDFKIIADKIKPYAKYIYLHLWGEPMLNPDIIKIIKYASQFSKTNISTNCKCLTPELAEELITSGVTEIIVLIDGTTQDVYAKHRVDGDLDKALFYLKLMAELNDKYSKGVILSPQFIVFEHNHHQMSEFDEICNKLQLVPTFKAPYLRRDSNLKTSHIKKYIRNKFDTVESAKVAMKKCIDVMDVMTIFLDGSVVPCCYAANGNEEIVFGNIFKEDVFQIFNNEKTNAFRKGLIKGKGNRFCLENCLEYYCEQTHI